ncbi:MAG: trypsin-like peptidase domain-containing protein, partial [Candidatus Nomurabacteria bacterium]|nr:trypsin-like peptidase domain-containing protein [Candidatus Nomurabacteria bacterium]
GFIVSQNGYIGTNGHVAAITVKELAIYGAILQYYSKGDSRYLAYLLNLTTLTNSDLAGKDSKQTASVLVDAFYDIPDSNFKAANDVDNILVNLSADEIDTTAFLEATYARQSYTEKKAVSAELVGSNYRLLDGYDGWRASDVALLKISGQNFPIVKLGSLDTLQQGADISILGYPGAASSNGLVESSVSEATLTTGKVSAKKKASGSNNMLVETDTTIGHGNSGGPAFNGDGEVIGIATYTIDGSGAGNGVYNYIRDIKDFKTLASSNNVKFDTNSETQTEWNEGINNFYASHYSKAVKNFEKVKELYPNHAKADEFIAAAEKRIANGEDVVDFPWLLVTVIAGVVLIGAVATVVVIVAHGKHHKVYQAGVAQGAVQPLQPGAPAQTVMVSQPVVQPAGSVPSSTFGQQPPQPTIQPFSPEPITPTTLEPSMPAPTAPPQASAQSTTPASNYYPQSNPGNLAQ